MKLCFFDGGNKRRNNAVPFSFHKNSFSIGRLKLN